MPFVTQDIPVAANGDLFIADWSGSLTLPTDATTAPDAAFTKVGYISEDGVAMGVDTQSNDIPAWQSLYPVRSVVTGQTITVAAKVMEWNEVNVKLAFAGGTWTDNLDGTFDYTPPSPDQRGAFGAIVDGKDGDYDYRLVFPKVEVTDLADIVFKAGEPSMFDITMKALPDGSGNAFYFYLDTNV